VSQPGPQKVQGLKVGREKMGLTCCSMRPAAPLSLLLLRPVKGWPGCGWLQGGTTSTRGSAACTSASSARGKGPSL
jgi:hypothetical protein